MKNSIVFDSDNTMALNRTMIHEADCCANCANSYNVEYHSCNCGLLPANDSHVCNNYVCIFHAPKENNY